MSRVRIPNALGVGLALMHALLASGAPTLAQSADELTPGDVVRIDRDFVGTLMAIQEGTLIVIGEGEPTCVAGMTPGEAPRCNPAPSVRRVVDWPGSTLERQLVGQSHSKRMALGALIGAAVLGSVGYATGPSLGYGKLDACFECRRRTSREDFDKAQEASDQKRGAMFFSVVGATAGAIIAKQSVNDWIEVQPPASIGGDGPWSVGLRIPLPGG